MRRCPTKWLQEEGRASELSPDEPENIMGNQVKTDYKWEESNLDDEQAKEEGKEDSEVVHANRDLLPEGSFQQCMSFLGSYQKI